MLCAFPTRKYTTHKLNYFMKCSWKRNPSQLKKKKIKFKDHPKTDSQKYSANNG